jgi:hypothetical protein
MRRLSVTVIESHALGDTPGRKRRKTVISRGWTSKQATRASAALAASALAIGVAACGGSTGGSNGAASTETVTVNHSTPATSNSAPSATPGAAAASHSAPAATQRAPAAMPSAAVPDYQPASVVSRSQHSTVLNSPDSISKIGSYYEGVLARGGWKLRSSSNTAYSASFTAHRADEGVTISVYPRGSGSGVSISRHPE